jgi:hypothetical protein
MTKYGFYSEQAALQFGSINWTAPDGSLVEVTCVEDNIVAAGYKWPDKVCLGEVIEYHSQKTRGYDSDFFNLTTAAEDYYDFQDDLYYDFPDDEILDD